MRRRDLAGLCLAAAPLRGHGDALPPVELAGAVGSTWRGGETPQRCLQGHAGEPGRAPAVAPDTLWRVASISKLAQAIVALRLAERGELDLKAPLDKLLGFALRHPDGTAISAAMLLSHCTGLRDNGGDGVYLPREPLSAAVISPFWGPRRFAYANFNSVVLGTVLESISGLRYDHLLRRELFEPLGMEAHFDPIELSAEQLRRVAVLQRRPQGQWTAQTPDWRREPVQARVGPDYRPGRNCVALGPQGGLITSLAALERLAEALRSGDRRLLGPAGHEALRTPRWQLSPGDGSAPDDTLGGLFRAWACGAQCFTDQAGGDRLHPRGGLTPIGHLAAAYGLLGGLLVQPADAQQPGWAAIYLLHGATEQPGRYSAFSLAEETLLTRLLAPFAPA